ncbi:MAG: GGDEF domain-containing response regulator [Pseudomonadota bacterium]
MPSPVKLLIIDDDPEYLDLLVALLANYSTQFQVDTASSFEDGRQSIALNEHDIYVSDYSLDNRHTGLEYLAYATEQRKPLIVITADDRTIIGDTAIRSGACDFVMKQEITAPLLFRILRNSLERHQRLMDIVAHQEKLAAQLSVDPLTGLATRAHIRHQVESSLMQSRSSTGALLYIDLDGFKPVNDRYGHAAGDQILQLVAQRFIANVHAHDIVARLGGDEFLIYLNTVENGEAFEHTVKRIAGQLLIELAHPYSVVPPAQSTSIRLHISASIGIIHTPHQNRTYRELLHCADLAMYEAKSAGRNQYKVFTEDLLSRPA